MRPFALVLVLLATACSSSRSAPEEPMQHLNAPGRTDTLPFSHGVLAGDFLFLAGTLGLDSTGKPPADAGEEARAMLDDFKKKLGLAGLTMDDLVQVQVFCSDLAHYDVFNKVYATYFKGGFPARAFIGSGPLLRGCRFEIIGIAARR
jgi:enamine deaminase RidA (YjgF/YER057c/UK114 family)